MISFQYQLSHDSAIFIFEFYLFLSLQISDPFQPFCIQSWSGHTCYKLRKYTFNPVSVLPKAPSAITVFNFLSEFLKVEWNNSSYKTS